MLVSDCASEPATMSDSFRLPPYARLDDDGTWVQVFPREPDQPFRPALFLDRDGVLVEEVGYLHRPEDVRLVAGAADVIAAAGVRNICVVIVTNQSGVGRGLYSWADFAAVQEVILAHLTAKGARIDAVMACPHHAEAQPRYQHPNHADRKPNPGMILKAAAALRIDRPSSWIVGDRTGDLEAGRAAGLAGGLLVTPKGHVDASRSLEDSQLFRVWHGTSIADALRLPMLR